LTVSDHDTLEISIFDLATEDVEGLVVEATFVHILDTLTTFTLGDSERLNGAISHDVDGSGTTGYTFGQCLYLEYESEYSVLLPVVFRRMTG